MHKSVSFSKKLSEVESIYGDLLDEEGEFLLSYRDLSVARGLMEALKQMIGNDGDSASV